MWILQSGQSGTARASRLVVDGASPARGQRERRRTLRRFPENCSAVRDPPRGAGLRPGTRCRRSPPRDTSSCTRTDRRRTTRDRHPCRLRASPCARRSRAASRRRSSARAGPDPGRDPARRQRRPRTARPSTSARSSRTRSATRSGSPFVGEQASAAPSSPFPSSPRVRAIAGCGSIGALRGGLDLVEQQVGLRGTVEHDMEGRTPSAMRSVVIRSCARCAVTSNRHLAPAGPRQTPRAAVRPAPLSSADRAFGRIGSRLDQERFAQHRRGLRPASPASCRCESPRPARPPSPSVQAIIANGTHHVLLDAAPVRLDRPSSAPPRARAARDPCEPS